MQDFRSLKVWAKAHQVTLDVYRLTRASPREELYGLTSQTRRSAVSVASNIAEGSARGQRDFGRFLQIAMGSAAELEYQLLLARDLQFVTSKDVDAVAKCIVEVKRMLSALITKLAG